MASIKDLEMAAALSANNRISIKKSLFGLRLSAQYEPTQSPLKVIVQAYAPADGEKLLRLLDLPAEKLQSELRKNGAPKPAPIGHFQLEACLSEDHQFCALQLFRFVDFKYSPVSEFRCYEGAEAEIMAKLF